jgi:MOSC domain-containing protein YiiM
VPELLAVCVVRELHADAGQIGTTAIDKRPQQHRVKIGPYGAYADVQADRKTHGGLDVSRALIGERWRVGSGEHAVELEVTSPRRPCQTIAEVYRHGEVAREIRA